MQREIFENAKEQINLTGKVVGIKIARDLVINPSTVSNHLKKMDLELERLIKKWQDDHDRSQPVVETKVDQDNIKVS